MLFHTVGQSQIFLAMASAGVLIGILYDLLRAVRALLTAGRVLTLGIDLVFGAASALFLIAFLYKANYAELRLYALLGAVCGLTLYECAVSPPLRWLARKAGSGLRLAGRRVLGVRLIKLMLK